MDPFSALSLAANVIQFVDFGSKVFSRARELHESLDGTVSIYNDFECVTKDLDKICAALTAPESYICEGASAPEIALVPLARSCQELGKEFLSVLQTLKLNCKNKKWESILQALKSVWKEKEIRNYKERLSEYRTQIAIHLINILGNQQAKLALGQSAMLSHQSKIGTTLEALAKSQRRLEVIGLADSTKSREKIVASLYQVLEGSSETNLLVPLTSQLSSLAVGGAVYSKFLKVIESLNFHMISTRRENIAESYPRTFDWLFEDGGPSDDGSITSFLQWLRTGNGIYWVSGRAGSGKSTLMKYLQNHEKTLSALKAWSGSKQVLTTSFFFWRAGTEMQKSQHGLLKTLLFHILRQCPALVPSVCNSHWQTHDEYSDLSWSRAQLLEAFANLQKQTVISARFCFFIDGLDEYDGDFSDIIKIMRDFTSADDIKVCFSSRPWNVFENAYGDNHGQKLHVHDHTRNDIEMFVRGTLREVQQFRELEESDSCYRDLVREIVDRAHGVFLWVFLVIRSLRRGLTNSDTISELQTRLHILPTDLEEYFHHMLHSAEKVYHKQSARIYLMRLCSGLGDLKVPSVSYCDKDDPLFGIWEGLRLRTITQLKKECNIGRTRVLARCTDLIEVSSAFNLDFLHRTVYDFLETRDIQDTLSRRAGDGFDPHLHLCNAMLSQAKQLPLGLESSTGFERLDTLVKHFFYHAYHLDISGNDGYFALVDDLVTTVEKMRNTHINEFDERWDDAMGATLFQCEAWVLHLVIEYGLYNYLHQEIAPSRLRAFIVETLNDALGLALRQQVSDLNPRGRLEPDPRIVKLLLDCGSNPSWAHGERTPFANFLDKLTDQNDMPAKTRHDMIAIVEYLMIHTANSDFLPSAARFTKAIARVGTSSEIAHLKELRWSMTKGNNDPASRRIYQELRPQQALQYQEENMRAQLSILNARQPIKSVIPYQPVGMIDLPIPAYKTPYLKTSKETLKNQESVITEAKGLVTKEKSAFQRVLSRMTSR